MMDKTIDKMFHMKKREYIYRRKESGELASHFSYLADVEQGSAVKTFRKQQQEKARLPVDIWNQ